ncbi:antitoxin [Salirhabdus euzebyi]|uniref:antitoxin n=1 Tax=Salirhabdus euzebyi TaxID=394506 RepID=UPI00157B77A5|nr:antitoxin [Salirhabdus euzebyi]
MGVSESSQEIVIKMPKKMVRELDNLGKNEDCDRNDLICQATKMYLREKKKRDIRESMRRGYVEMANINLNIASEAFQAEEEAENTLERLVSGV